MKNLTLWQDQLRSWSDLTRDMDRWFERQSRSDFSPACDIEETDSAYRICLDMPGVQESDVKIELNDGVLSISGERHQERREDKAESHFVERKFGRFLRSFSVPPKVDSNRIEAHFDQGVLKLTLPKSEAAKPKEIKISSGHDNKGGIFKKTG